MSKELLIAKLTSGGEAENSWRADPGAMWRPPRYVSRNGAAQASPIPPGRSKNKIRVIPNTGGIRGVTGTRT